MAMKEHVRHGVKRPHLDIGNSCDTESASALKRHSGSSVADSCRLWNTVLKDQLRFLYLEFEGGDERGKLDFLDPVVDRLIIPVIGSYNVGKSALINSLIDENLLVSAPVEQTVVPWVVQSSGEASSLSTSIIRDGCHRVVFTKAKDSPFKNIILVDTPGYGGVDPVDGSLTPVLSVSHAIILCISSQAPVTAHDLRVVEMYRQFKRPVIIALTKADLCKDEAELISVLTSVRSRMSPTLQFCPHVHPVSSSADSFYDLPELRCTISALESDPKRFTSLINNCAVHILTQRHEQLVSRFQRKCRYITQRSSVWTDLSKKIVDVCTSIVSDIASCRHSLRRLAHLPQPMDNVGPAISAPLTALRTQIGHSLASLQRDMRACFGQNENSVDDDAGETCKSSDFNVYDGFDQVDQEGEMFFTERDITIPVDNILANKTRATNGFNLFVNESNSLSEEVEAFKDQSLAKIRQAEQYLEATLSPSGEDAVGERSIFDKGLTATSAAGVMVATALNPVVGVCAAVTWLAATKLVNRHNFANASDTKEQRRQQRLLGLPLLTLDQVANDVAHLQQASISLQHRAAQDDESIIALRRRLDDLEQTRLSVTSVIDSVN